MLRFVKVKRSAKVSTAAVWHIENAENRKGEKRYQMLALLRFATVARLFLPYVFPYILRSKPWEKLGKFKFFLHIKKGKCQINFRKRSHIKKGKL